MFTGPNIITDGLVLYLDAANAKSYPGSGTTWSDLSGNGNNGTLINGPTFDSGSIQFDGVDDYTIINGNPDVDGVNNFTVYAWFNKNTGGSIFSKRASCPDAGVSPGNNRSIQLSVNVGGDLSFIYPIGTGGSGPAGRTAISVVEAGIISNNEWTFVAVTFDSSNVILYKNGQEVHRETPTVSSILKSDQFLRIGTSWNYCGGDNSPSSLFNGDISVIVFYNKTLTSQEVLQNYNATKGRYGL